MVFGAVATVPAFGIASVNVFGLNAPEEIEGFTLNNSTNFEKIKPGDGFGLDYSQSGWKLDVFIYDLKRAAIPDDVKTAIVKAEFERARAEAFLAQPRGLYAQVYLRRNFTIEDAAKRTRFQCAAFHLTRDGAKPQDGFLCVTSWNNKFVKLRLTTLSDNNTEDRRAQIRQRLDAGAVGRWRGRLARRAGPRTGPVRVASASTGAAATSSSRAGTAAVQMPGRLHLRSALRV